MIYRLTFRGKDPIQSIVLAGFDKLVDTFSGMPQQPCTDSFLRVESTWILKSETRAGNEGFIEHVYARFKDQSFVKAGDEWESSSGFRMLVPYRVSEFPRGNYSRRAFCHATKIESRAWAKDFRRVKFVRILICDHARNQRSNRPEPWLPTTAIWFYCLLK